MALLSDRRRGGVHTERRTGLAGLTDPHAQHQPVPHCCLEDRVAAHLHSAVVREGVVDLDGSPANRSPYLVLELLPASHIHEPLTLWLPSNTDHPPPDSEEFRQGEGGGRRGRSGERRVEGGRRVEMKGHFDGGLISVGGV